MKGIEVDAAAQRPGWSRSVKRVVVKLGSSTVLHADLDVLAACIARMKANGVETAIVSSGAVAMGMRRLGIQERPGEMPRIQALAAVGQGALMAAYQNAFEAHGLACAQVLLTHEALSSRVHFMNVRHTLNEAFALPVVPIANENDTVAIEELRFGDNDRLAAALATVADADLVILLSDVDALYDADPRRNPDAKPVSYVDGVDALKKARTGVDAVAGSAVGTGGMWSKLDAAELAMSAGIPLVVASGDDLSVLPAIAAGAEIGTLFTADKQKRRKRHWIAWLSKVKGRVVVDAGAVRALVEGGSSLLAAGVVGVDGAFERGDAVAVIGPDGSEIARGLVGYRAEAVHQILGCRTAEVRQRLGLGAADPVIHRNDLHLH